MIMFRGWWITVWRKLRGSQGKRVVGVDCSRMFAQFLLFCVLGCVLDFRKVARKKSHALSTQVIGIGIVIVKIAKQINNEITIT